MKITKSIFTAALLLLLGFASQVKSQGLFDDKEHKKNKSSHNSSDDGGKCFDENTKIINLGVGFIGAGGYYSYNRYGDYTYKSTPALSISYEHAIPNKLGPGFLGIGAYLGYQRSVYTNYDYYDNNNFRERYLYTEKYGNTFIAARFAYHLDALNFEKGEVYFGAALGLRIHSYSYQNTNPYYYKGYYKESYTGYYPGYSFFVGGRYYLTKNIGLFGELGYGISYITLGLSFKF